jgi:hypothetical protein
MMKKVFAATVVSMVFCLFGAGIVFGQENDAIKKADDLDWTGQYRQEKDLLFENAGKNTDAKLLAEIYWRLARATLNGADEDYRAKRISTDEALKLFEEGEGYANKAIGYNSQNALAYFWKSSNIGIWGQTKGVLDSLFKVGPMNDNLKIALQYDPGLPEGYYVLGELYEKAPGWPISLGNVEYAVSLGRKSIDLMDARMKSGLLRGKYYVYFNSLASHLWARNWDAQHRANAAADQRRQFDERRDNIEKNFFYEGTISIPSMSDREEARQIIDTVISELEKMPNRTGGREKDLNKARELSSTFR